MDGPGDELVVLRSPNRGSPPVGLDLKISTIDPGRPKLLFQSRERVSAHVWPLCAGFRTTISVDLDTPKPRDLTLRTELAATDDCEVSVTRPVLDDFKRTRVLSFDPARRQFVGTAGPAL